MLTDPAHLKLKRIIYQCTMTTDSYEKLIGGFLKFLIKYKTSFIFLLVSLRISDGSFILFVIHSLLGHLILLTCGNVGSLFKYLIELYLMVFLRY